MIRVRVAPETAQFLVCAQEPVATEDSEYQYTMSWRNSPFAADRIQIEKHPNTNVLKSIAVESLDQTDQFLFELAKAAGALAGLRKESALEAGDCASNKAWTIINAYMDPGDPEDVRRNLHKINQIVMNFVRKYVAKCNVGKPDGEEALTRAACEEYRRIALEYRRGGRQPVELHWARPQVPLGYQRPDCSIGLCYRALLPYMLSVSVANAPPVTQPYMMPNNSPVIAIDISRGIAITKTTRIGFSDHGQPTKFFVQKGDDEGKYGAEAVELAKLPATMINAYYATFTSTLASINSALDPTGAPTAQADVWTKSLVYATDAENVRTAATEDATADAAAAKAMGVKTRTKDAKFVLSASNSIFTTGIIQTPVNKDPPEGAKP